MIANFGLQFNQKLWIFFDEFNTSENLGLICEMLSDRKLLGESLPDNMVLLAACNPYKLRSKKIKFDENVGIKRSNERSRVDKICYYTLCILCLKMSLSQFGILVLLQKMIRGDTLKKWLRKLALIMSK